MNAERLAECYNCDNKAAERPPRNMGPRNSRSPTLPSCLQTGRPTCQRAPPSRRFFRGENRAKDAENDVIVDDAEFRSPPPPHAQNDETDAGLPLWRRLDVSVKNDDDDVKTEEDWWRHRRRRRESPFAWITLSDVRWRSTGPKRKQQQQRHRRSTSLSSSSSTFSCRHRSLSSSSFLCHPLFAILLFLFVDYVSSNWQKNLPANLLVQPEG